jgi:putative nucleotidyltransferase with HDIG domain
MVLYIKIESTTKKTRRTLMSIKPTREEALALLKEFNKDDWHIRHALAVEAVLRYYARLLNVGDEDKWGVVGLLHDIDFELYPTEHCTKAAEILRARDIDEDYIHAVVSHGYGIVTDVKPEHIMEKVLFTIDELTGLITAVAIMRPSKSILDLELSSVKKKFKTPGFAAGVSRKVIEDGAAMLGFELDYVIQNTILGMREAAAELGLKGTL